MFYALEVCQVAGGRTRPLQPYCQPIAAARPGRGGQPYSYSYEYEYRHLQSSQKGQGGGRAVRTLAHHQATSSRLAEERPVSLKLGPSPIAWPAHQCYTLTSRNTPGSIVAFLHVSSFYLQDYSDYCTKVVQYYSQTNCYTSSYSDVGRGRKGACSGLACLPGLLACLGCGFKFAGSSSSRVPVRVRIYFPV